MLLSSVDPPKSLRWRAAAPEKRETLKSEAPLFKGGWGDLQRFRLESELCVYTLALLRGANASGHQFLYRSASVSLALQQRVSGLTPQTTRRDLLLTSTTDFPAHLTPYNCYADPC
jgi:hypothetical protein